MIFEKIKSEVLAHNSYLIGMGSEAVVIDPRRDCDVYIQKAREHGMRIKLVLETHRNEDYVIGSKELAKRAGAEVWHADSHLKYRYGKAAKEGQEWKVGALRIKGISTPGHTEGSMSYILYDAKGNEWAVFTGDALFAGDVGRTDLVDAGRAGEMAGVLYGSVFKKLLKLGDGVLVCPSHGAGSVCGSEISEREWTTIGIEKKTNPKLQVKSKREFVKKAGKILERPPYFREMEKANLNPPLLGNLPSANPLSPSLFRKLSRKGQVLDTRMELGFGSAHVPGAINIWKGGLSSFVGWFLSYGKPIYLVAEGEAELNSTVRQLVRMGYDNMAGSLAGGMLAYHMAGMESGSINVLNVQGMCELLDGNGEIPFILDVRSNEELEKQGEIAGAKHMHITTLPKRMKEIPKGNEIFIFCGSGLRSMVAASILRKNGWKKLNVIVGGLSAWKSSTCQVKL